MTNKSIIIIGSLLLALGVAIGAFGAHGLASVLIRNERVDTFETGVLYHFIHALGMLLLAVLPLPNKKIPMACFIIGILCFSVSLYTLSLTNILWLGAVAPIGGIAFIVGWLSIGWIAYKNQPSD